jgi:hypothetical protein
MRALLLLALCILFSGCTRIAFTVPVGKPVPPKETADLKGEWIGEGGVVWKVEQEPGSEQLVARGKEDGKEKSYSLTFTMVGKDVPVLWAEDKDLKAYIPLRFCGADDDAVALLVPDEDEVKKLVTEGKLAGVYNQEKRTWIISKGDWDALMGSKDFWELNNCYVFTRNKRVNLSSVQPPAVVTPPAGQGPVDNGK